MAIRAESNERTRLGGHVMTGTRVLFAGLRLSRLRLSTRDRLRGGG